MPRIIWRSFQRGLWLNGAPDSIPDDALRRATGIDQMKEGLLRSAKGVTIVNLFGANQFVRFADHLYQGSGVFLRRDGSVIDSTQDGTRLAFLRAPVGPGLEDYLFVAGGGNLIKVKSDGTTSQWGIDTPADGATIENQGSLSQEIDELDDESAYTTTGSPTVFDKSSDVDSPTIAPTGSTDSIKVVTNAGTVLTQFQRDAAINANLFTLSDPSFDQDYISLWFQTNDVDELVRINIDYSLGNNDFSNEMYSRRVDKTDFAPPETNEAEGVFIGLTEAEERTIASSGRPGTQQARLNEAKRTKLTRRATSWVQLKLPKNTFDRVGTNTFNWSDVEAVRYGIVTRGTSGRSVTCYFGKSELLGGYGVQGTYQFLFTYKNSVTGNRSNSNPTPLEIQNVERELLHIADIPQPTDPQVDTIEVWNTFGSGALFFHAADLPTGTTDYDHLVADFRAMASGAHIPDVDLPEVLGDEELPINNDVPFNTFDHVACITRLGRAWWCGDGTDRVYFSREGYPESLDDFVTTNSTDDTPIAVVVWNDAVYAFGKRRVFRITGDQQPFIVSEVFGVPGVATDARDTIITTPFGLLYRATDGLRVFNGTTSELASSEAILPIFRGRDVENVTAFAGSSAAYTKDAYYIVDGEKILVLDLRTGAWRHHQIAADTIYAEGDDEEILIAIGLEEGLTTTLEDANANAPSIFEVQTYSQRTAVDVKGYLRRIFFDIDTGGADVAVTLILDDGNTVALPGLNTPTRTMLEYSLYAQSRLVAVNLLSAVSTEEIKLYGIELDIYVPNSAGDGVPPTRPS